MAKKVLFVVTNHTELGDTGNKTGWYLPEVAHPYDVFVTAGYEVDYVSPKGGFTPLCPASKIAFKGDESCDKFRRSGQMERLKKTLKPSEVKASDYKVIFYAGGHGPMFDLPKNEELARLAADIYENENSDGVVCAVCHGTVGLLPIKLKSGDPLLKGKDITSFTNDEENAMSLMEVMPFALETKLKDNGAKFHGAVNWAVNVKVDDRVVTGQNPASAGAMAEAVLKVLSKSSEKV